MKIYTIVNILIAIIALVILSIIVINYIFPTIFNKPLIDPEIERILIDDMTKNNKRISVPLKLNMDMGEAKTVYVGIKNDKNSKLNYKIQFDILVNLQGTNVSYKSTLKYNELSNSLEQGDAEVTTLDISIPVSDFSKGDYVLEVSVVDTDLNEIYASEDILVIIG